MKLTPTKTTEIESLILKSAKEFLPSKKETGLNILEVIKSFEDKDGFYLFKLTDENNNPLGYISNFPKDSETSVIGPMFIDQNQRGKGLSTIMIELFIEWAKVNNFKFIKTKTWGNNSASRHLFEKFGFKLIEEKLDDRINGDSTVVFLKSL